MTAEAVFFTIISVVFTLVAVVMHLIGKKEKKNSYRAPTHEIYSLD